MPAPTEQILADPTANTIAIRLEPAASAFHSLALVAQADHYSGLGEWVTRTAAAMTETEQEHHRLLLEAFFHAVHPEQSWPSFPAYVDHLAAEPATALRDRVLARYAEMPPLDGSAAPPPPPAEILRSRDSYLAFLRHRFDEKHIDEALESRAYTLLTEPAALQTLVVDHLRQMWDRYLATEWEAVRPMLAEAVAAFRDMKYDAEDRAAVFETITGRPLPRKKWEEKIAKAERLIFVPSAHVGPYLGITRLDEGVAILFGARLPAGAAHNAPDLSRAEILVRLNALADETRLRILRLVSTEGELRSPEIMERLDLSQSAASRHLSQLTATGYLVTRRCEGANCYRLHGERIEDTLRAVGDFLRPDGPTANKSEGLR